VGLLVHLRRGTWGLAVTEPLLILPVVLYLRAVHPVFPLDAPAKVGEKELEFVDVRLVPGRHLTEPENAPFVKKPF